MILSRFLKPKWQHTDPETRKQALQDLEPTDPTLTELARQDADPAIRRAALERLDDLDLLQTLVHEEANPEVRAAAQEQYHRLLAGKVAEGPPLDERLERLRQGADPTLIEFLLRHAVEPELRLTALEQVTSEPMLAEIAAQNAHLDVRLAALERVQDHALLEQVVRQSRNRDKRVYRQAKERVDAHQTAQTQAAHLERLCDEMENLRWDGESGLNAGRFPKLDQERRSQESAASPEQQERYGQARERFLTERQTSANRRIQRLELIASLENLLERLRQQGESSAELTAAIQYGAREAPAAWAYFGAVQDSEGRRLEQRFQELVAAIHEQERILQRNRIHANRLREVLEQAEKLLTQPSEVQEADIIPLRKQWETLERPESPTFAAELQSEFDSLLDKLRARIQRQLQERDREWQELQEVTTQLEAAIENGESQQATTLQEQARRRLKQNIGLSRAQMAQIEDRLQSCAAQLGKLRDWRRWGAYQAREQLCATAESLIGLEIDPTEIARRIQQARDAWKELDHREGAAPKALWKRFNHTCERAYAPCQAHFEAQARERQQNFAQKSALCVQLEQFEATTDWEQVDWREADRLRRRTQEQWYKLGPVNRADRKSLDRRFHKILQRLDTHLDAERQREVQRRQQLIEQVQGVVESADLRIAIETAKRAQAEWPPTVQASPRQEQTLWKAFRAACDAVFARRQAEYQAADSERQTHLASKQALCEEIEALAKVKHEHLSQARARLHAAQQEWDAIGPIPRTEQRTLEQRFDAAIRQFADHEQTLRRNRDTQVFQHLHQYSRLCAQLEALLTMQPIDAAALEALQQAWATLPELPQPLKESLQRRYDRVCQALTGSAEQIDRLRMELEQNLERKKIWCVCMEIVAGLESPPAFAQLRMEYQVARLSASLAGDATKPEALYDPKALHKQWRLTGALPPGEEAELDARFLNALQTWQQREEV
jgi:hypothetical protein